MEMYKQCSQCLLQESPPMSQASASVLCFGPVLANKVANPMFPQSRAYDRLYTYSQLLSLDIKLGGTVSEGERVCRHHSRIHLKATCI